MVLSVTPMTSIHLRQVEGSRSSMLQTSLSCRRTEFASSKELTDQLKDQMVDVVFEP